MRGILADVNIEGHFERLRWCIEAEPFRGLWLDLGMEWASFDDLSWPHDLPDDVVWDRCQTLGFVLLTGNRNKDGSTSLEATIRVRSLPDSLAVLTISRPELLMDSRDYANRIVKRLLDLLYEPTALLGSGRLYLS